MAKYNVMDKPHYHGHRQRLRKRLSKDSTALADYELLELLLALTLPRQDTKPLAKVLLDRFGSLRSVLYAPTVQLREIKGFGPATEVAWTLLTELWARMQEERMCGKEVFSQPAIIADAARARFGTEPTEELWAVFMDSQNRAFAWEKIASGSVSHASAQPRDVISPALKHEAARVVLVHNHPGASAWPSADDKIFTQAVVRAGQGVNIEVVDHIIVTELDYFSFHEDGLL